MPSLRFATSIANGRTQALNSNLHLRAGEACLERGKLFKSFHTPPHLALSALPSAMCLLWFPASPAWEKGHLLHFSLLLLIADSSADFNVYSSPARPAARNTQKTPLQTCASRSTVSTTKLGSLSRPLSDQVCSFE